MSGVNGADLDFAVRRRAQRRPLGDEAASYVRDLIMSGGLRSGEFVRPEVVADALGISATPVREALLALRGEGFVHLEPRRGFAVSALGVDDIRDLFTAQALLAGELAARAARRITAEDLDRLEYLQDRIQKSAKLGDLDEVEELNWSFHRTINMRAQSPKIAQLMSVAVRCVPTHFYARIEGWPKSTIEDHRAVLEALRRRSTPRSRSAMATHITHAGELLAMHYESSRSDAEPKPKRSRKAMASGD
jgi:DNA-binding GntR family transcriptional regulator